MKALRLGNDFIGTEHTWFWSLIRDSENTAVKILKSLNIDLYELRKEIENGGQGQKQEKYCQY